MRFCPKCVLFPLFCGHLHKGEGIVYIFEKYLNRSRNFHAQPRTSTRAHFRSSSSSLCLIFCSFGLHSKMLPKARASQRRRSKNKKASSTKSKVHTHPRLLVVFTYELQKVRSALASRTELANLHTLGDVTAVLIHLRNSHPFFQDKTTPQATSKVRIHTPHCNAHELSQTLTVAEANQKSEGGGTG